MVALGTNMTLASLWLGVASVLPSLVQLKPKPFPRMYNRQPEQTQMAASCRLLIFRRVSSDYCKVPKTSLMAGSGILLGQGDRK